MLSLTTSRCADLLWMTQGPSPHHLVIVTILLFNLINKASLISTCSASLGTQQPKNSETQGQDRPSLSFLLCTVLGELCIKGWFSLWLSLYWWHISFWCLSRTPMRCSTAIPMSALSVHQAYHLASPGSHFWIFSVSNKRDPTQCCTLSVVPSASNLHLHTSGRTSPRVSCNYFLWHVGFFSGAFVASWPFLAFINLIPCKLQLDCISKNVIMWMASFLSFLPWCRTFLFVCLFGHFRKDLIGNGERQCSSCVFVFNRNLVILHLECLQDIQRETPWKLVIEYMDLRLRGALC